MAATAFHASGSRVPDCWLLLLSIGLSAVVYAPAAGRFFTSDDFLHLYQIVVQGFWSFLFQTHGGHVLIPSNLAFYVCHALFGLDASGYYGLAVLTHLANVALLFAVIRGFSGHPYLAALGALAFGMSPTAVGSVGLFSSYGHVLATSFFLWVLRDIAARAHSTRAVSAGTAARWWLLLVAGGTSFGVGLPVSMAFGAVVFALLPHSANRGATALRLGSLLLVMPVLFLTIHTLHGEQGTGFVGDRLADGLALVTGTLTMTFHLCANGLAGLLLGPWLAHDAQGFSFGPMAGRPLSDGLPVSIVLFTGFCVAGLWRARSASRERRLQLLALAIVVLSGYAVIAVGRAGFYENHEVSAAFAVSPLRYHYLGPAAFAVMICLLISRDAEGAPVDVAAGSHGRGLLALWLVGSVAFYWMASPAPAGPADAAARAELERVREHIAKQVRGTPRGTTAFIRNRGFAAGPPFPGFPGYAGVFVISHPNNELMGRQVRFVEPDPAVRRPALARANVRARELIVPRRPKRFRAR